MIKIDKLMVVSNGKGDIVYQVTINNRQGKVNPNWGMSMDDVCTYYDNFYPHKSKKDIKKVFRSCGTYQDFLNTWTYADMSELRKARVGWGPAIIEKCIELSKVVA